VTKNFPKINFSCQNVCSLNISKPSGKTRRKLSAIVKDGADIIFLSDTRLNSSKQIAGVNDIEKKLKFLGYSLFHNSVISSRGCAVLVSDRLNYVVVDAYRDEDCNMLFLKIKLDGLTITVGSVYGPNGDDVNFFNSLKTNITYLNADFVVLGGDWNTTQDARPVATNIDILNTANTYTKLT
jgi:exonuclease III